MTTQLTKFEVGSIYHMRSIGDADCVWRFQVTRRTAKSVWLKPWYSGSKVGEITRRKIAINGDCEIAEPFGRYSMSPVLKASNLYGQLEYLSPVDETPADIAAAACEADSKQADSESQFVGIPDDDDLVAALVEVMTVDRCCDYVANDKNPKANRVIAAKVLVELFKNGAAV